jgi:hypothetical protein
MKNGKVQKVESHDTIIKKSKAKIAPTDIPNLLS